MPNHKKLQGSVMKKGGADKTVNLRCCFCVNTKVLTLNVVLPLPPESANSSDSGTGEAQGLPAPSGGARAGRLRNSPALREATLALAFALAFPAALGNAFALAFAFTLGGIAFAFVRVSGRGLIRCLCLSCKTCCLTLFPPFSPLFPFVLLFSRPLTLCSWR